MKTSSRAPGRATAVDSVRRPSAGRPATGEVRRLQTFPRLTWKRGGSVTHCSHSLVLTAMPDHAHFGVNRDRKKPRAATRGRGPNRLHYRNSPLGKTRFSQAGEEALLIGRAGEWTVETLVGDG